MYYMLRCALILTGNLRTFENCIPNLESLIDIFNPDIYLCISDIEHNLHPYNKELLNYFNDKIINEVDINLKLNISQKIKNKIKKVIFLETETENKEIEIYTLKFDTKKDWVGLDIFKQYYKIKKCINILELEYNYIIKSRFDVEISSLPSFPLIDDIYINSTVNTNDITLVSNKFTFDILCNSIISHFLMNREPYTSIHSLLDCIFKENNINVNNKIINATINKNYNLFDTGLTLVTCFYDIGRNHWKHSSRTIDTYFINCENVLNKLNPIVIFTTNEYIDKIKSIRKKTDINLIYTKIIILPFEELKWYGLKEVIKKIQNEIVIYPEIERNNPEFVIPDYIILINNKTEFMYKVSKLNYFNSTIFQWVDFGIHPTLLNNFNKNYFSNIFYKSGKIRICSFKNPNLNEINYLIHQPTLVAGLFGGDAISIQTFYELTTIEFENMIKNRCINQEQYIYYSVLYKNPDLFDYLILPHWDNLSFIYQMNTINIGICMSGHMRTYPHCKENIEKMILNPLKDFNVKLFLSTWGEFDSFGFELIETEQETNFFFEKFSTDNWKNYIPLSSNTTAPNSVSQLYKMNKVYHLTKKYNFDIIIRIRPDIIYNTKIDLFCIKNCLYDNCLYMPEFHNKYPTVTKGIMDQFFFGNKKTMDPIMKSYTFINNLLTIDCHSTESLLYQQIKNNGVIIKRFLCNYGKIETNGSYLSFFK